jgi:hypothetical protein
MAKDRLTAGGICVKTLPASGAATARGLTHESSTNSPTPCAARHEEAATSTTQPSQARHADGRKRIRAAATLATATLIALAAACGSEDSAEDDVKQTLQDQVEAINEDDVKTVRELTSQRCREQVSEDETRQTIDLIDELYGDIELQSIDVTDITEDSAQVNVTTGIDALDNEDSARWILEDGQWRMDDC